MTKQNYYLNMVQELLTNKLLTITEAKKIEIRAQKLLGYKWPTRFDKRRK